jgi:hypothetical protein
MSKEMARVTKYENQALLGYGSAIVFDNRLLMTALPSVKGSLGVIHKGIHVLDFDPLSSMTTKLPPAWDGLWCGLRVLQLVKGTFGGRERAYAFVLDSNDNVKLWEITKDDKWDNLTREIVWFIETKDFAFGDPFSLKKLEFAELYRDRLSGTVSTDVKFRPDQHPVWVDWHDWQECATTGNCTFDSSTCPTVTNYQPQYRASQRLPQPSDACDAIVNKPYRRGYTFQVRLQFTGYCRLKALRLHAFTMQEDNKGVCTTDAACVALSGCNEDTYPVTATATESVLGIDGGGFLLTDLGDTLLIE